MPYFHIRCFVPIFITLCYLFGTLKEPIGGISVLHDIQRSSACHLAIHFPTKTMTPSVNLKQNINFSVSLFSLMTLCTWSTWLYCLLLTFSGDIHPNPGPSISNTSPSSTSLSAISHELSSILQVSNNLSLVHYNIQSLLPKIDLLATELSSFDILTFSETWLSEAVNDDQILLPGFSPPVRQDRTYNSYGGVAAYVKEGISFLRRPDLEINNVESIWL